MLRWCNNTAQYQARRRCLPALDERDGRGGGGGLDWRNLTMMMVMMMGMVLMPITEPKGRRWV